MSRRKGPMETPEYASFVRRAIRAYGRRVRDADEPDLAEMVVIRDMIEVEIAAAVTTLAERYSWRMIGKTLGMTGEGARQRYYVIPQKRQAALLARGDSTSDE